MIGMVQKALGPTYDVATHFTPRYNPWDQRLCLVPDDDLFRSLKKGKAEMVTDTIDTFTETGLRLASGRELAADIVVAATGLKLKLLGGMALEVDGAPVALAETMTYKGMMYSGVPNLATALGYTNASWTLKCDLTCVYVCRLLAYMDRKGYTDLHAAARPIRVRHRKAADRLLVGLHPARDRAVPQTGLEDAVAALSELRARLVRAEARFGSR